MEKFFTRPRLKGDEMGPEKENFEPLSSSNPDFVFFAASFIQPFSTPHCYSQLFRNIFTFFASLSEEQETKTFHGFFFMLLVFISFSPLCRNKSENLCFIIRHSKMASSDVELIHIFHRIRCDALLTAQQMMTKCVRETLGRER